MQMQCPAKQDASAAALHNASASIINEVDDAILSLSADSSKKAYDRYKALYEAMEQPVHSEESVLAFLMKGQRDKGWKPTTLWTVRSHILSYLKINLKRKLQKENSLINNRYMRLEHKIEIADTRTTLWLKKLNGITTFTLNTF